jgi:hypothetical protein
MPHRTSYVESVARILKGTHPLAYPRRAYNVTLGCFWKASGGFMVSGAGTCLRLVKKFDWEGARSATGSPLGQ